MVNYQNGKIYKIVCDETGMVYYGSTVQRLSDRLAGHKTKGNLCMTKDMINPKIYLVEYFPCNTKEELTKRERYFIENNECINRTIPGRTPKEYYEKNKDNIKEYYKEWRAANKEQISQKKKEKCTCECGLEIRKDAIARHRKSKKHQKFIS